MCQLLKKELTQQNPAVKTAMMIAESWGAIGNSPRAKFGQTFFRLAVPASCPRVRTKKRLNSSGIFPPFWLFGNHVITARPAGGFQVD